MYAFLNKNDSKFFVTSESHFWVMNLFTHLLSTYFLVSKFEITLLFKTLGIKFKLFDPF